MSTPLTALLILYTKEPSIETDDFEVCAHRDFSYFGCDLLHKNLEFSVIIPKFAHEIMINKMTAIDLRANTMQILDQFDKADASLWQKVLDAVTLIYKGEEKMLHTKRAEQKAKIRQMVGILNEESLEDWKREKEEYLAEKYQ